MRQATSKMAVVHGIDSFLVFSWVWSLFWVLVDTLVVDSTSVRLVMAGG
jgi:hypothetical protein